MTDEIWKAVPNADGYMVSNHGRMARILSGSGSDYVYAYFYPKNSPPIRKPAHRVILEVFGGPPPDETYECNHKDGNKKNNRVENLEWLTPSENRYHSYRVLGAKAARGENHPRYNKFGALNQSSKKYICTSPEGKIYNVHGLNAFCKRQGLDVGTMSNIARGRYGCKSHKGWKCQYVPGN